MGKPHPSAAAHDGPPKSAVDAIADGHHGDPFAVLGPHRSKTGAITIAAFVPEADGVEAIDRVSGRALARLERLHRDGFFFATLPEAVSPSYRFNLTVGNP